MVIFCTQLLLLKMFKTLNGLLCADVTLRNYSLTHLSLQQTCQIWLQLRWGVFTCVWW